MQGLSSYGQTVIEKVNISVPKYDSKLSKATPD